MEHIVEIPLFCKVSKHFKDFLQEMGNPISPDWNVQAQYWRKRFTFFARRHSVEEKKASITPCSPDFSQEEIEDMEKKLSQFASKVNFCSSTKGEVEMSIELISPLEAYHGRVVTAKLRLTVRCNSVTSELALRNFFSIVDN